jgi:hypothetical protein
VRYFFGFVRTKKAESEGARDRATPDRDGSELETREAVHAVGDERDERLRDVRRSFGSDSKWYVSKYSLGLGPDRNTKDPGRYDAMQMRAATLTADDAERR